jgi:hypothetical protein
VPCILEFTTLKPRRDVLVFLGLLCRSHGKTCRVSTSLSLGIFHVLLIELLAEGIFLNETQKYSGAWLCASGVLKHPR